MSLNTRIRGVQIKDADITVTQMANDAIETLKIKDLNVTLAKLADMGAEAHILVADAGSRPVSVAIGGDISIIADGTVAIASGVIVDDDVNASAAIAMSKLNLAITDSEVAADAAIALDKIVDMADTKIMIGSGSGNAEYALSGDVTMSNAGVTAIGATKVTDTMMNDDVATGLAGSGLTATAGVLSVDAITDNLVEADILFEDESSNCDGNNTTFTLGSTPVTNSVQVFLNGLLQQEGSGKDFTLTGTTVEFATAPETNDILLIHYILND